MKLFRCDRCTEIIGTTTLVSYGKENARDLCPTCVDLLRRFLEGFEVAADKRRTKG